MSGFLLLQYGQPQSSSAATSAAQQTTASSVGSSVARGASLEASRGSRRSATFTLTPVSSISGGSSDVIASAVGLDMLTTTTVQTTIPPATAPPTTLKPTTTTTKPKPLTVKPPVTTAKSQSPVVPKSVDPTPSGNAGDEVWTRLAKCESGMRNDTGDPFWGFFQFTEQTWLGLGGTGHPSDHSYQEQLDMAKKLQARSGWNQWPVCSKVALRG